MNTHLKHRAFALTRWRVELLDKFGRVLSTEIIKNLVTLEGQNALLDIMFHGSTQITTWYILIFESDSTPTSGSTYAAPGFTECTAYDESTREEFIEGAAAAGSLDNVVNEAEFTMNATKTIYGAALSGGGSTPSTKGDTSGGGTMYAAVRFATAKEVVSSMVLKIAVTITAADDGV